MKTKTKWILFDFGGCLDSDGEHSRDLFLRNFIKFQVIKHPNEYKTFQEAYTHSDQTINDKSLAVNSSLIEMNQILCLEISNYLSYANTSIYEQIAKEITNEQTFYLKRNKDIVEALSKKYKLGIISNFSGNLSIILKDHHLMPFFDFVLDSYHVGITKPDLGIFELAIKTCKVPAQEILYCGDNIDKDIIPAKKLGMKTILLSNNKKTNESNYTLKSLSDLLEVSQRI